MTNPTTRYGHIEPEHQGKTLNVKEAGPGEVEHHGGSFRKYMDNKNRKLQEQFDQQSAVAAAYGDASGQITSTLFSGVSITVNGFTTPSQQVMILCMVMAFILAGPQYKPVVCNSTALWFRTSSRSWHNMEATLRYTITGLESLTSSAAILQMPRLRSSSVNGEVIQALSTLHKHATAFFADTAFLCFRNPTPVVRPEWIVDSLKAGVILPVSRPHAC